MKSVYYTSTVTILGDVGIVWRSKDGGASLVRIFLPAYDEGNDELIRRSFPGAVRLSHAMMKQVCRSIQELAAGRDATFSEKALDMKVCGEFQRRVLSRVMQIQKGKVSTYGRLAEKSRALKGGRAVGNALAMNPYPLLIPCHRVIRSDGSLGGFGGGLKMKKELLLMEGITFDPKGRVLAKFLC
ncbi:MAG TPA: methylated-DNA--[protein]-cysteine S-methyltransferase [Syntrophales bacterium]